MFTHPARPRTNEGVRMKLNLGKEEIQTATMNLVVRVKPSTHKMWKELRYNNPQFKSYELIDLALKALIKEHGTGE